MKPQQRMWKLLNVARIYNIIDVLIMCLFNYQNPKIGWSGPLLLFITYKSKKWMISRWKDRDIENWG
jgi:hypothetical protein